MKVLYTLEGKDNQTIQIYRFASAYYVKIISASGFTHNDSILYRGNGSWQEALKFAYRFQ